MTTTAYELGRSNTVSITNEMQSHPSIYEPDAWTGMGVITPGGILAGTWKIERYLIVELKQEGNKAIAIAHDIDEYGIGDTVQDAMSDLLTSMVDCRLSLEKRADKIAEEELRTLKLLKETIIHVTSP